jgi:hypothetical protein
LPLCGMTKIGDSLMHFGGNEPLVRALIAHRVEFLVIGGLAVSWYCHDRQADDMDILVNPTAENSERIYAALSSLGLTEFSPVSFSRSSIQAPLKNAFFYAELLTPKNGGPTYDECTLELVKGKLYGIPVDIVGLEALIRLKEHAVEQHERAGSGEVLTKHRNDLDCLKRLSAHAA